MSKQNEIFTNMPNVSAMLHKPDIPNLLKQQEFFDDSVVKEAMSKISAQSKVNFDKNNCMARITFPENVDHDVIAAFLILLNSSVMIPVNTPRRNKSLLNEYMFIVNAKTLEDFLNKYTSMEDINNDPLVAKFYEVFSNTEKQIDIENLDEETSAAFLETQKTAYKRLGYIYNSFSTMRDKINFLYSLCSDNIRTMQANETQIETEKIFTAFLLQYIAAISNTKDEKIQNALLDRALNSVIFDFSGFEYKANKFKNHLGVLKFSNPLSMEVVLNTGEHKDLFNLDTSKKYKIMHSVNVAKINKSCDFSKLDINGDFICSRAKAPIVMPKSINGLLDCSYCCDNFLSNIKIPKGTKCIDLSGTIKCFADINDISFPKSVTELLVNTSVINTILKSDCSEFNSFIKKYPNIQIWDSKHKISLHDSLEQSRDTKTDTHTTIANKVMDIKQNVQAKTDDWLSRKEIVYLFKQDTRFDNVDIDRLVKRAINSNNTIPSQDREMNGVIVTCNPRNKIEDIKNTALHIIAEDEERAKQTKNTVTVKPIKSEKQTKQTKQKPVKIAKFIPKQIWKDICDSCKDSTNLLYSVLQRIDAINIDYTKQPLQGSISYIDSYGQVQLSPSLRKKLGNSLAQSVDENRSSDRKRIVWTMNSSQKIIVAVAFCEEHAETHKASKAYMTACKFAAKGQNTNGEVIDKDFVKQNNCFNVKDLLQKYTQSKTETFESETQKNDDVINADKPVQKQTKIAPVKTSAKTTEQESGVKTVGHANSVKRPKSDNKTQLQKIDLSQFNHDAPIVKKRKRMRRATLVDVKALEAEIDAFITRLDNEIKKLCIQIEKQKDNPQAQMRILDKIKDYIQEKISLMQK